MLAFGAADSGQDDALVSMLHSTSSPFFEAVLAELANTYGKTLALRDVTATRLLSEVTLPRSTDRR